MKHHASGLGQLQYTGLAEPARKPPLSHVPSAKSRSSFMLSTGSAHLLLISSLFSFGSVLCRSRGKVYESERDGTFRFATGCIY